jgi:predicted NUDIX family NTP pyrophosphohydrolase
VTNNRTALTQAYTRDEAIRNNATYRPSGRATNDDGAVMATRRSAGILLFRRGPDGLEVLLGHLGGPLWARRDDRAWTIPKGEYVDPETPEQAARREFVEELGRPVPDGELVALGEVRQAGGKIVTAWALEADLDPATVTPGTFEMQWPPRSGRTQRFPELDRVQWFDRPAASRRIVAGQREFLDRLGEFLDRLG